MNNKYRPANGYEGAKFLEKFCSRCKHDQNFNDPCEIIIKTMELDIDDMEYPKEWVLVNKQPTCIKFKQIKKEKNKHG